MRTILKIKGKPHIWQEKLVQKRENYFSCFLPSLGMDTEKGFPYKALRFSPYIAGLGPE
tara:strand:- start:513 stop:689 length:177 start_codon:yes stop_codon:yes gene_type:complete